MSLLIIITIVYALHPYTERTISMDLLFPNRYIHVPFFSFRYDMILLDEEVKMFVNPSKIMCFPLV